MSDVDEMMADGMAEACEDIGHKLNSELDRKLVFTKLTQAFSKVRKNPVDPKIAQYRMDQIEDLANRLTITFDTEEGMKFKVDPQDELVHTLLKFGCEWHESLDVEAVIAECLPA